MRARSCLLSCLIYSKEAYDNSIERLKPEMFDGEYRKAFSIIRDIRSRSNDEQVSYVELLNRGVSLDILSVLGEFPTNEGYHLWKSYLNAVITDYNTEKINNFVKFRDSISETEIDELMTMLTEMKTGHKGGYSRSVEEIAKNVEEEVRTRREPGYNHPFTTGLFSYDRMGHFERGYLCILAGGSGHGKSSFALNLAYRYLTHGLRVAYFTYEMSDVICLAILTCIRTGIPWDKLFITKDEGLSEEEFEVFLDGLDEVKMMPITISEIIRTPSDIKHLITAENIDVFIVDTVNYLIESGDRFWLDLTNLSNRYKDIARDNKCLGIVIAQRDSSTGRPTHKNLLAMSRHMKDAADVIDVVYREAEDNIACPELMKKCLEIYRVKGRLTGTAYRYLHFDPVTKEIRDLEDWEESRIRGEIGR